MKKLCVALAHRAVVGRKGLGDGDERAGQAMGVARASGGPGCESLEPRVLWPAILLVGKPTWLMTVP